jgi:hypothetical protein
MNDPMDQAAEVEVRLNAAFEGGAERYADLVLDPDHEPWLGAATRRQLGEYSLGEGFLAVAVGLLAEQTLARLGSELEEFLNHVPGRAGGDDHAKCLMMALLLSGRRVADAAQIRTERLVFGDALNRGLEQLTIEPDAHVGDFTVDFLLTYSQEGPNPANRDDPSQPIGITVTRRLALVRDGESLGKYQGESLRRQALADSLKIVVVSYSDRDIERDPFPLATRVVRDLAQLTFDDLYG